MVELLPFVMAPEDCIDSVHKQQWLCDNYCSKAWCAVTVVGANTRTCQRGYIPSG